MHTKLSPGRLKVSPPENSCMFHLSLAIYAMTIIVFEAKERYVHWTSESTQYVTITFSGYYAVTGSPYNSVFAQDMTS